MKKVPFLLCLVFCCSLLRGQTVKVGPMMKSYSMLLLDTVKKRQPFIPSNFATCNYGFFCKQELQLEKKTHVPVKFRLGTLEQTNWLEGKSRYKPAN